MDNDKFDNVTVVWCALSEYQMSTVRWYILSLDLFHLLRCTTRKRISGSDCWTRVSKPDLSFAWKLLQGYCTILNELSSPPPDSFVSSVILKNHCETHVHFVLRLNEIHDELRSIFVRQPRTPLSPSACGWKVTMWKVKTRSMLLAYQAIGFAFPSSHPRVSLVHGSSRLLRVYSISDQENDYLLEC